MRRTRSTDSKKKKQTRKAAKPDIMARLKQAYGNRMLTAAQVLEMREAELEGEEG